MVPGVARYHDKQFGLEAVKILPGQYHSGAGDGLIVTVLGSCVAACLHDPAARIGGMNHFMLPGGRNDGPAAQGAADAARLGVYAMELLINQMLKLGADRSRIVAKVFGGGSVLQGMDVLNIGNQNGAFVLDFLQEERIPVLASDLYDACARKVYFFPDSGRVLVKRLGTTRNDTIQRRERDYLAQLAAGGSSDVEIFARG
jgi:chemotaxis protein CheD